MPNIQDVARYAHVGAATVSRVLNGTGYVKEETRARIMNAIEELNYTPNEMARNLFFKKTGIVAVIVPELGHPFFSDLVNHIEVALTGYDYQMMVCNTYYEQNYELRYLDMLNRQIVDGIIFGSHTLNTDDFRATKRPIVAIDREMGEDIPCITADHEQGGLLAARALAMAGCKKVLQLGGSTKDFLVSTPSNIRNSVFSSYMKEHGIECIDYPTEWNKFGFDYTQIVINKVMDEYPDIDGIFGTDIAAMAALKEASLRDIRVPDELKIVSYDGTPMTALTHPMLTCVVQPVKEIGQESVRVMMELIKGERPKEHLIKKAVFLREGGSV